MKILCVLLSYYPNEELIKKNLCAYIDYVDKIIIWENTPLYDRERYRFVNNEKIEYIGADFNSISRALNYAAQYAIANKYDYLLTMDQDSVFCDFGLYYNFAKEENKDNYVLGPNINNCHSSDLNIIDADLITSGTLVPVSVLHAISYNENFDIDGVDLFFCHELRKRGFHTMIVTNCILIQRYGNPLTKSIFGVKLIIPNYSAMRIYETIFSHVIVIRFFSTTVQFRKYFFTYYLMKMPLKIIFFERSKMSKIISLCKGLFNGIIKKI